MTFRSTIAGAAMLAAHPTTAQEHRFEADPGPLHRFLYMYARAPYGVLLGI
jgi:hypothetical protein